MAAAEMFYNVLEFLIQCEIDLIVSELICAYQGISEEEYLKYIR